MHKIEKFAHPFPTRLSGQAEVERQRPTNDFLHADARIERRIRHLKDNLHPTELILRTSHECGRQRLAAKLHGATRQWRQAGDDAREC